MKKIKSLIVGGHEQACNILDYLISNNIAEVELCIARKDDNGSDGIFPSLIHTAKKYRIPTIKANDLNSEKLFNIVNKLELDIVFSLQNNMLFNKIWVDFFSEKLGIVNVHYSPLPKYAGFWPELWAIWNQEKKFAVTAHYINNGIDTGDIIGQRWFKINENENRKTLYDKSTKECFILLKEMLPIILTGNVPVIQQNPAERTYYTKKLPNEGYLDFNWDQDKQKRFVRAISFPGYPGPKIKIGNQIYTILNEDIPNFHSVKLIY